MKWKESFSSESHENESTNLNVNIATCNLEVEEDKVKNIFNKEKCNLPTGKAPQALLTYLAATKSDILGSCEKPRDLQDNLKPKEREAIKDLIQAQACGLIQIKPVDKGGGFAIMRGSDYIGEMSSQLNAYFTDENGTTSSFYEKTDLKSLEEQKNSVALLVEKGYLQNLISKTDKNIMQPSGKPN